MSKSRKPLKMQKGNLTVEQQEDIKKIEEAVIVGRDQLEKPPKTLIDKVAKKEWKRVIAEIMDIEIIGNLDLSNLVGYCNSFSQYTKATQELADKDLIVRIDGEIKANPLIKIQKTYAEEMRKFSALCGLTIDSRMKAGAIKVNKDKQDANEDFDI